MKLDWDTRFPEKLYIHKCFQLHAIIQRVKDHHAEKSVRLFPIAMNDRIKENEVKLKEKKGFGVPVGMALLFKPFWLRVVWISCH